MVGTGQMSIKGQYSMFTYRLTCKSWSIQRWEAAKILEMWKTCIGLRL